MRLRKVGCACVRKISSRNSRLHKVALGIDAEFSDGVGLIAAVTKGLGHGGQFGHRLGFAEIAVAVGARAGPGHERASTMVLPSY